MAQDELDDTGTLDEPQVNPGEAEERQRLNLEVKIDERGACQRHVTVTIPRADIDRYFDNAFSELMGTSHVPGFRPGRAPRELVERRFRKDAKDQVKGALLLDSLSQLTEEQKLAAISEPDLNAAAVEVPDEGPMIYEFDLEVRPEFDVPEWKGLKIERPTREITDEDVETRLNRVLADHGQWAPYDGAAEPGDMVSVNIAVRNGEAVVATFGDVPVRLLPVLSFRDGNVAGFARQMQGVKSGETRECAAKLTTDAPNPELRGKEVTVSFEVLEVKRLELPELTPALLAELGDFESEDRLRDAVKLALERQLNYQRQQRARQQILGALTVSAKWDLPPEMLRRQAQRELERFVLELQSNGFSDAEIRAHSNELRQNSLTSTARALKEHFILEKIAESEEVTDEPRDYELEVAMIATQSGESPRRVRAQLEKRGQMDALRNQIIERKVLGLILSQADFKDVPFAFTGEEAEALDISAGGGDEKTEIPEAQRAPSNEPAPGAAAIGNR